MVYNQEISYVNIVDSGTYMYTGDALHHSYLSRYREKQGNIPVSLVLSVVMLAPWLFFHL